MHVLVGTDGSPQAVKAAQRGVALLRPDRVTLLTVLTKWPIETFPNWEESFQWPDENDPQWTQEIGEAKAALDRTGAGLTVEHIEQRIDGGDVAHAICDAARGLEVDAIVVGSHGRGGLGRSLLGSVSEHVVRHASCPVLVVREPAAGGPAA